MSVLLLDRCLPFVMSPLKGVEADEIPPRPINPQPEDRWLVRKGSRCLRVYIRALYVCEPYPLVCVSASVCWYSIDLYNV